MPGMAGGANAKATASGTCARSVRLMDASRLFTDSASPCRSSHGSSVMKKNAV